MSEEERKIAYQNGMTLSEEQQLYWKKEDYLEEKLLEMSRIADKQQEEIERLNNIINKVYEYLDKKKDVPEWWDTDFMICMNILKGGTGYLKDILGSDKE